MRGEALRSREAPRGRGWRRAARRVRSGGEPRPGLARAAVRAALPLWLWAGSRLLSPLPAEEAAPALTLEPYRGWSARSLGNGLVKARVVPEIGGRVIQLEAGGRELFWVSPRLAGREPPESGLAPGGGWLDYGGDKLWPAPQGWGGPEEWPGPPGAVLDGQPWSFEPLRAEEGSVAARLTSRDDPRSGIRFSRVIRLFAASTRVEVTVTMKNIDTRPRRWGIWSNTQLAAAAAGGREPNRLLRTWCPVHPGSRYRRGFRVIFGAQESPSFRTDWRRGLVEARYRYRVGKIGADSPAGWVATVNGESGLVFVQRFDPAPGREHPDGATVEVWHNGPGKIHAFGREVELSGDPRENPFVLESEVLGPFCELAPGESCSWRYEWLVASVGGDFPVLECNEAGVVAEPLSAVDISDDSARLYQIRGRFGVFAPGKAWLAFLDERGGELRREPIEGAASPLEPLLVERFTVVPAKASSVRLLLERRGAREPALLAEASLRRETVPGQWSREKAWQWYEKRPWPVGCNFLPSTAVNDVEMWQADTFDEAAIERELGWARAIGFNTVRIFLNFVVWKDDPDGLKQRFARFLEIADRHGISALPILFDDCNFAHRVAAPGKQLDPIPGVHNSQWVSSPPLAMVTDRGAWGELERYARDVVGRFGRDRRVLAWDLYNEPGNSGLGSRSLPLAEAAFRWARAARPSQPLTIGAWRDLEGAMSRRLLELSDVVSFHGYDTRPGLRRKLEICRRHRRPILCTEWLHRQSGSTVEAILPWLQAGRVGCWSWGLVFGRTQTYMPWGSKRGDPVPERWQHDLLHPDGRPYRPAELELIRRLVQRSERERER